MELYTIRSTDQDGDSLSRAQAGAVREDAGTGVWIFQEEGMNLPDLKRLLAKAVRSDQSALDWAACLAICDNRC